MTINASEEDERSRWALSIFENQVYNESHLTWSNVSFFFGVMCLFHYNVLIYKFWTIAWPHGVSGRTVGIPWSSMPDTGWLLINAMCSYHCFHLTERNWQIVWCIKLQSRYWSKKKVFISQVPIQRNTIYSAVLSWRTSRTQSSEWYPVCFQGIDSGHSSKKTTIYCQT